MAVTSHSLFILLCSRCRLDLGLGRPQQSINFVLAV